MDATQTATLPEDRPALEAGLIPFIPPVLYEWPGFAAAPERSGAILFLDVAGFTHLSEALAAMGPEGAEVLDLSIARYFDALQDVIDQYGGLPIKISGDALSILFWDPIEALELPVRRALACAAALRDAGSREAGISLPGGLTIQLAHKIGIGAGNFIHGLVGDPAIGREYIFAGEALDRAAAAEHHSSAGETWIGPEAARIVGDSTLWDREIDGFYRLRQDLSSHPLLAPLGGDGDLRGAQAPAGSSLARPDPSPFLSVIPAAVRKSAATGTLRYLSRHQTLTALFVGFTGLQFNTPAALEALDLHYRSMQRVIDAHGGFLSEFEAGDKGSKLIVFFGAPSILENPCLQAAMCARAMQAAAQEEGIVSSQRIGTSTGRLYVGRIGYRRLAKYSALGDRMNLAARLMAEARADGVVAERMTVERSRKGVEWSPFTQIRVRGKREPVEVATLCMDGQAPQIERRGTGLIGRRLELGRLRARISDAVAHQGRLVVLEGGTGVGKTRLVDAVTVAGEQLGARVLLHRGVSFALQSVPLAGFKPLLMDLVGVEGLEPPARLLERFRAWLESLPPALQESAARLAPVLELPAFDDPVFAQLEPSRQLKVRQRALIDCLLHCCPASPRLFILDNAQHLDEPSIRALEELTPILGELPLMVVVSRRPPGPEAPDPLATVLSLPAAERLELGPLEPGELAQLATQRIGAQFLDQELTRLLMERTQGNPLRIESWIEVLKDRGHILVQGDGAFLTNVDDLRMLPDRLESIVLARLEQLPADVQLTVRVASLMGLSFQVTDIVEVHPQRLAAETVTEQLRCCHSAGLVRFARSSPGRFFFNHPEVQAALYESLPYQLRRSLHAARARAILETRGESPGNDLVLELARHYEHIDDPAAQHRHFDAAARLSEANYDHRGAVHWLRLDLAACQHLEDQEGTDDAYSRLNRALELAGEVEQRTQVLDAWVAEATRTGHRSHLLAALQARAAAAQRTGDSQAATADIQRALEIARSGGVAREVAAVLCAGITVHGEAGRFQDSLAAAEEAMSLVEEADKATYTSFLCQKVFALEQAGRTEEAYREISRVLTLLDRNDLWRRAMVQGNLGVLLWMMGRPEEAHRHLLEALQAKRKVGDRREEGLALLNVGFSFMRLGEFKQAQRHTEESLRLFTRLGYVRGELISTQNLGEIFMISGQLGHAAYCFARADHLLGTFPHEPQLAELRVQQGELRLLQGEVPLARQRFEQALELARSTRLISLEICALEGLAEAARQTGNLLEAGRLIEGALALLEADANAVAHPQRVWYRAARIADQRGEPARAAQYRATACQTLARALEQLESRTRRRRFGRAFSWNREILAWKDALESAQAA